jgi:hypothetical protein
MKTYIKENAAQIAELVRLYKRIQARDGYKLGLHLKSINNDFQEGIELAVHYTEDYEQGGIIWRSGYKRGDPEMLKLLTALLNNEKLFQTVKDAEDDYQGRIKWRVEECTRGFDFKRMQDAYYTEQTIALNPDTLRVTTTKPREYSRSVLVALNID